MTGWNIELPGTAYFELGRVQNVPGEADRLQTFVNEMLAQPAIAIDTETTGLVLWKDIPLYWSVAWPGKRATLHANMLHYFQPLFQDRSKSWIMANAKYDTHILANVGINLAGNLVDTCVQHALLYEDKPHGLKFMAQHLHGWTYGDFQDQFGKIGAKQSAEQLIRRAEAENMNLLIEYAANDAWATWTVYETLRKQLQDANTHSLYRTQAPYIETLWDLFSKIEVPYTRVLWTMERQGIKVNRAHLEASRPEAETEIHQVEREIAKEVGFVLNPQSPKQLQDYFFNQRKHQPIKWSKGGKSGVRNPSCDSTFLEHIQYEDIVAKLVLRHRELTKLHGTYIVGLHDILDPNDRIHTRFNQDVARCMPAGELVLTDTGYIPVEDVRVGHRVLTHNGRARRVVETSQHAPKALCEVTLSNGCSLRTTENHQYLLADGTWLRADELPPGAEVVVHSDAEIWRPIRAWPDYVVSSWGRVRNARTGHILKAQSKGKWGHLKVTLSRNGAQVRGNDKKDKAVHRLVAEAFLTPPLSGDDEIRHLNGIAWDNTVSNLCYGTSQQNSEDARLHGTLNGAPKLTPAQVEEIRKTASAGQPPSSTSKLTFAIATRIREDYVAGVGRAVLAKGYGVSYQAIDNIVKDRTWLGAQEGVSADELGKRFGVSAACIRDIWAGRRWVRTPADQPSMFHTATVVEVRAVGADCTYGLTVEEDHSHVTGGIVTHNTGRLSSSEPNLQNIPRPENDKWNLRSAFIPEPGNDIIAVDYEQLEMRLLAAAALERDMIGIFERKWDIHMGNAALMFNLPYDDLKEAKNVDKKVKGGELPPGAMTDYVRRCLDARAAAKAIGFGLNYGMGAKKLGHALGISPEDAQMKIDQYKATYPAVSQFFAEAVAETAQSGYAFTLLGRRRNVTEISSHRRDERARGERMAINTQIQGSAADVCKMAQIRLMNFGLEARYGCKMLLQIHDELVFECPKETTKEALADIKELMEHPFTTDLAVHLAVDTGHGSSWGAAK